jgi:hypothetical protein
MKSTLAPTVSSTLQSQTTTTTGTPSISVSTDDHPANLTHQLNGLKEQEPGANGDGSEKKKHPENV